MKFNSFYSILQCYFYLNYIEIYTIGRSICVYLIKDLQKFIREELVKIKIGKVEVKNKFYKEYRKILG